METLLEYIKNRIRATVDENEYQKKLMKGPYNNAQIEYAYGIADAIMLKRNLTQSVREDNIYDIVVRLLVGNRESINHAVNGIRAEIMALGGDEYKIIIECMHQIISRSKAPTIDEHGEFLKSKLVTLGLENGLSEEQIEVVYENMVNHEDIIKISEEKYRRSW